MVLLIKIEIWQIFLGFGKNFLGFGKNFLGFGKNFLGFGKKFSFHLKFGKTLLF